MALKAQDRLIEEKTSRDSLTSYGSADVVEQGFRQDGLFEPYRYNFNTGDFATFVNGQASAQAQAFEITLDAWTPVARQYLMDSTDKLTYLHIDQTGVTLGINGASATWAPWAELDGQQITLRFERVGNQTQLRYRLLTGDYVDLASYVISNDAFVINTIGTVGGEWRYIMKNSLNNFAVVDNELNWRGHLDHYVEFTTEALQVSNSSQNLLGTDNSSQDNNTTIAINSSGGDYVVRIGWRGILRNTFIIPQVMINPLEAVTWRFTRDIGQTITLRINDVDFETQPQSDGLDMRIRYIGDSDEFGGTGMNGVIYDVTVVEPTGTAVVFPCDDNTGTFTSVSGTHTFTIQNYAGNEANWVDNRKSFEGHMFELFMGDLHWTMGSPTEYQTNLMLEDGLDTGNDMSITGYLITDWVDLGEGSVIYHISDDGTGPENPVFVMEDNSSTLFPSIVKNFIQEDYDNFATNGGLVREVFSYPIHAPVGQLNGGFQVSFDNEWVGDIALYDLNGLNDRIQRAGGEVNPAGSVRIEATINIGQAPGLGDDMPILGASNGEGMFGFIARDMGTGQKYQFCIRNWGGYQGGVTGSAQTDLDQGHYSIVWTHPDLAMNVPATLIVTNVDTGTEVFNGATNNFTASNVYWNYIGWCNATASSGAGTHTEQFARGTVYGIKVFSNGDLVTPVADIPVRDGAKNAGVVMDLVGVDWIIDSYDADNWYYDEATHYGGMLVVSEPLAGGATNLVLVTNLGNKTHPLPASSDYVDLVIVYEEGVQGLSIFVNGVLIPALSGPDWWYDGAELADASFRTSCGGPNVTGVKKFVKLHEFINFEDDGTIDLTPEDFRLNKIVKVTGVRKNILRLPRADTLEAGATVTWASELPSTIVPQRTQTLPDSAFVLNNLVGTDTVHMDTRRGTIICGNIDSVDGYTAYFSSSLRASAITRS